MFGRRCSSGRFASWRCQEPGCLRLYTSGRPRTLRSRKLNDWELELGSLLSVNTVWCLDPESAGILWMCTFAPTTSHCCYLCYTSRPLALGLHTGTRSLNGVSSAQLQPGKARLALVAALLDSIASRFRLACRTSFPHHMNPSEEAPTAIRGNFIPVSGPSSRAASLGHQRADAGVHIHLNLTDAQMDRLASSYVTLRPTTPAPPLTS